MLMDQMTEIVAHMVGIFHVTVEEDRMRTSYDKFVALKASYPEYGSFDTAEITFTSKYDLEGFTPGLRYSDKMVTHTHSTAQGSSFDSQSYPVGNVTTAATLYWPNQTQESAVTQYPIYTKPQLQLEPAGSVVTITHQTSFLNDDDLLLLGDGKTVFTHPDVFLAELQQYQTITAAIAAPLSATMITPGATAAQDAIALHQRITTAQIPTLTGVSATMLSGADAYGLHINGETADTAPNVRDLLPAIKSDGTEDTDDALPDPFEGLETPIRDALYEIHDGHAVVTGANTLVNEVLISTAWIDAPVISVMGDVVDLNVISQINVLFDHDAGGVNSNINSTVMNAATLTAKPTTPAPIDEPAAADVKDLDLPHNWVVTKIQGDLVCVNQISQYNFITDHDRAEITFDSTNTYIAMGDNTATNLADLSELGFGYDLIMIGGSMISVNWITQINTMIDNDHVTFSTGFEGGDNLLFNGASITNTGVDSYGAMQDSFVQAGKDLAAGGETIEEAVAHNSLFDGTEILRVLFIEGDMTALNWIEQTNILGDSDQVHQAMNAFETAFGSTASVTTGSNSTINLASIKNFGIDSTVAVNGNVYDDATLYQAELISTDAAPLGVSMPALLSEAVVFLAEDMLMPEMGDMDMMITTTAPENVSTPDMMQVMLA